MLKGNVVGFKLRFIFGLLIAGLGAYVTAMSQQQQIVLGPIAKAPVKARSWKNPYEGRMDAVRAGEKLFRQHCAECHGDDAGGIGKAANLRSNAVQNATPGELVWFLRDGNLAKGMPSWVGLPIERRWQIVTYLKSLPASSSRTTVPAWRSAAGQNPSLYGQP